MTGRTIIVILMILISSSAIAQDDITPEVFVKCPRIHVENALKAMGGKDTLKNLKSIFLEGYGHRYKMDQSDI